MDQYSPKTDQLIRQKHKPSPPRNSCHGSERVDLSLSNILRTYKVCYRAEGKSPKTVRATVQAVTYLADFLGGIQDVKAVNQDHLRAFINTLREKKKWSNHPFNHSDKLLSPFSIACYIRSIRAFWSWMERENYIENNLLKKVKVPKCPSHFVPAVTQKELQSITKEMHMNSLTGFRDYLVLLILVDCGLRVSELCNLKMGDVNLEDGCLKVVGKGSRERVVPIGPKVSKLLAKWLVQHHPEINNSEDHVFVTTKGTKLTPGRVEQALAKYSMKALGKRIHPHQLRHTCAIEWLRGKGDPLYLQRLLGHRDLATTRIYVNLVDDDIKIAHKKYGVVEKLRI